jgi:hypothetical protein
VPDVLADPPMRMRGDVVIGEQLSSDVAFTEFLATRKVWKVRMEDPAQVKWSSRRLARELYESETDRLRGVLRLAAQADQIEKENRA